MGIGTGTLAVASSVQNSLVGRALLTRTLTLTLTVTLTLT